MADYQSTTPEGDCIFCKIIEGDIKTPGIFWENDKHMAFLSTWPNTKGFSVVVTKEHLGSDVLQMEDSRLGEFVAAAKNASQKIKKHFKDVGRVGLIMEGLGIDHAHIKLFPMHGTEYLETGEWKQTHSGIDKYFENYEGYISSHDGPEGDTEELAKLAEELRF